MDKIAKLYSTQQAAAYLSLRPETIKYHVDRGNLKSVKVGHSLVFSRIDLDRFKRHRRRPGRPRQRRKE